MLHAHLSLGPGLTGCSTNRLSLFALLELTSNTMWRAVKRTLDHGSKTTTLQVFEETNLDRFISLLKSQHQDLTIPVCSYSSIDITYISLFVRITTRGIYY
jgi:hypothetical protein